MTFWVIYLLLALLVLAAMVALCHCFGGIDVCDGFFLLIASMAWPVVLIIVALLIVVIWVIDIGEYQFAIMTDKYSGDNDYE